MKISESDFEDLYKTYRIRMLKFVEKIVYCPNRSEDIVQEAFARLTKQDYEKIKDHIMQWLFTVCRNLSFKLKTKEKRYIPLLDNNDEVLDEEKNPYESLDFSEQKKNLLKCIKKLSPLQKKVIQLRYLKQLDNPEIAKKLKIKTNAVAFHVCKGKQNLLEIMKFSH
jgi:RNA polymerase sigma-70 factor (ECF subfamily)